MTSGDRHNEAIAMQTLRDDDVRTSAVQADATRAQHVWPARSCATVWSSIAHPVARHSTAFFLFGTINNSLYVVILTAALELIPKGTPTGLVAFFNIFPALVAKAIWPYILKGEVRYTRRIWSCVLMNAIGLLIISLLPYLWTRLTGIALASFSSGLGELTFLQLSTRFTQRGAGRSVAWFSSGTGAAGLVGALAWWIVRPLGVRAGLLSLGFLPISMGLTYAVLLPSIEAVDEADEDQKGAYQPLQAEIYDVSEDAAEDNDEGLSNGSPTQRRSSIGRRSVDAVPMTISPHASAIDTVDAKTGGSERQVRLSMADKIDLIKPMLFVYILPLVLVYFFEYTINQGVAPTLLFPLPTKSSHPLLALVIKRLTDYYPFYQLTYQTFVFLSRSSISIFHLPAIPKQYLWVPAVLQGLLFVVLCTESLYAWFRESIASPVTIVLIGVEGLAGGSAYVSVFYSIGTEPAGGTSNSHDTSTQPEEDGENVDETAASVRRAQEHEFRIGCVGVGDTMGILIASLVSIPLQLTLCRAQVDRGRTLCKEV